MRVVGALSVLVVVTAGSAALGGCGEPGTERSTPIAVTRVEATACDRPQPRLGVGTVVADGVVLTAAHVVEGDLRDLRVDGASAVVVGVDIESDLALLAVEGTPPTDPRWIVEPAIDAVSGPVEILTDDGVIDTTLVRTLTLRVDDISAGVTRERATLELAVIVEEGDSGSPVVDAAGRLVGIVVLRRSSTGVSYASRIPAFTNLLDPMIYQDVLGRAAGRSDDASFARDGRCT